MPYTPPENFVAKTGSPLEATDLNANLDELEAYIQLGFGSSTEIEDDSIGSTGIRRPISTVSDTVTSTYLQTGSVHHIRLPAMDYLAYSPLTGVPFQPTGFVTAAYHSVEPGYSGYRPLPNSWVSYYSDRTPTAVLVRYSGEVIIPNDNTGSSGVSANYILVGHSQGGNARESTSRIKEITSLLDNFDRRLVSGCALYTSGLSAGWASAGLVCGLTSNFGLIGGFEITVEVIY